MKILVTGGAGYIGSHTAVELLQAGHSVVLADNYCNSSPKVLDRIRRVTGREVSACALDIRDRQGLLALLERERVDCVIHCAGLKAVGESVSKPLLYYQNNLDSTLALLACMAEAGVKRIVFSSSATVYGSENPIPYTETMPRGVCSNPYGWTKAMIEQIMMDAAQADPALSVVLLRYFNPIGAHPSGLMGENPAGVPNNLMPYLTQVAIGRREKLTVFGNDYPTPDGTCRRDYIHVMDLADGHVKAVEYAAAHTGVEVINLGTGTPYSVLELVHTFEDANHLAIPYAFGPRRLGDLPEYWADSRKAARLLGWTARRSLADMCRDSWNWQRKNPNGYGD